MTAPALAIRPAQIDERERLEELQRRASVHEPMFRAQLEAHPDAIDLPVGQIEAGAVRVAEQNGDVVGFAVLLAPVAGACELDGLFVEPGLWGRGVGRELVADAERLAREQGATRIDVVANPQALAFYERVGFRATGRAVTRFGAAPRMSLALACAG
jgi:N-acetylglutamate synthase-like GNAT family acetyltransferase